MSLIESGRNVTGIMLPTGEVVAEKVIFKYQLEPLFAR